jgi:hypothetical protein
MLDLRSQARVLEFEVWSLFGIWDLEFGISTEWQSLRDTKPGPFRSAETKNPAVNAVGSSSVELLLNKWDRLRQRSTSNQGLSAAVDKKGPVFCHTVQGHSFDTRAWAG